MSHGAPQRSILGLILVLLYVNDLPLNNQDAETVLCTDDAHTLVTEKCKYPSNIRPERLWRGCSHGFIKTIL